MHASRPSLPIGAVAQRRRQRRPMVTLLAASLAASLTACSESSPSGDDDPNGTEDTVFTPLPHDLVDPDTWYDSLDDRVLGIDLRLVPGTTGICQADDPATSNVDEEDYSGCTLDDLLNDIDSKDAFDPFVPAHFSADDFPDDASVSNTEMEIRGATSRLAVQKSWRIKLDSKDVLWRGERRLQLNKHPWELARVRNKLSFDLFSEIDHLPSLRTQFTQLRMDSEDMGLFTHAEHVGKEYLVNRGWDKDSPLYKAEAFAFHGYDELFDNVDPGTGELLDEDEFERRLEVKRGDDHRPLLAMLRAVNDEDNDFESDVMERYFNRNNYLTWLAVNILSGNWDTQSQNFYLYSPLGSERFYFVPWDYDGAWGWEWQPDNIAAAKPVRRWSRGISNWWDSKLHRRFLQQPGALDELGAAVDELYEKFFQPNGIGARLDGYKNVIRPHIAATPDNDHLPTGPTAMDPVDLWSADYDQIAYAAQQNRDDYYALQDSPMPYWMDARIEGATTTFSWDTATDLQGDAVHYELYLAEDPALLPLAPGAAITAGVTHYRVDIADGEYPRYAISTPAPGSWYLKILAIQSDATAHWQIAFDSHWDQASDTLYHGVRAFSVP